MLMMSQMFDRTMIKDEEDSDKSDGEDLLNKTNFEEKLVPNVRLSIRKTLTVNENSHEFAMNFLIRNFSDRKNTEKYPELCEVPDSIKPSAVIKVSAYQAPEETIFFKVGKFSQRLIYYEQTQDHKWTKFEQDHIDAFYALCKQKGLT